MRKLIPVGVLILVLAALGLVKAAQIAKLKGAGWAAKLAGPPPEVVGTVVAARARWVRMLSAVGNVAAVRGVTVSNEVAGMVKAIRFRSGASVKVGEVLVELDSSVERGQLATAKARMELAEANLSRSRQLASSGAIAKMALDADEATQKTTRAERETLEAQIARKVVRAPFAGRLGIRAVNLGQYLQAGTPIVVIESLGAVFIDFSLPQQQLDLAKVGTPVRVGYTGEAQQLEGRVVAIDPAIESATRSVKLRASVADPGDVLRPGMFVDVQVVLDDDAVVVAAPGTAVVHASYGDSVFIVEGQKDKAGAPMTDQAGHPMKVVRQQFVRVGQQRGDFVALTAGVTAGQELVTAGAFKLHNGDRVTVRNEVKPKPSLAPDVENR